MEHKISFVYFDLGGVVILDISTEEKWARFKRDLGIKPDKDQDFERFWDRHEREICIGRDVESLVPFLERNFNIRFPSRYSLLADFVDRFKVNNSIWPVVDEIHQSCKIGLLTNMYPGMFTAIKSRGLLPRVSWDVIIDSSVECMQKPDFDIFSLGQQRAEAAGEEILFIDNSSQNIETARSFGWQTFLYDPSNPKDSTKKLLEFFSASRIA